MALMKKLTSAIVASSLVLGLVGTVGATTPDKVQTAADRMFKLALINGVTPGANPADLALNANLTRAQLVTILVRAFGQESNAKYLNGAAAFPDSADHPWASGYIAMAKRIITERSAGREAVGMPDGTFNADGNVTAAEAVAFLMKFVGAPKDDSLAWPDNYIQGAANAGLITAEDKAVLVGVKNAPATRGLAFYLADRTFYGYKLAEGGTTYTTFVDNVKPGITVDAVPATTLEDKVIVTGTVANDAVAVHVGAMDNAATIANGKFTATVNLKVGDNDILVHAVDLAGNASEQTVKVTRTLGAAASIEAADITVGAGESVDVAAVVKDAKGNAIADAAVTGESTVGTFAAGKFTAGEKAGEGTVKLTSGELTKEVKVTVTAGALATVKGDKASVAPGKELTLVGADKFGNTVIGVTFSEDSASAVVEGSTFVATKAGTYTVKGTKGAVTVEGKIGVFGEVTKLVASAAKTVVGNDVSEVEVVVSAVDAEGTVVGDFTDNIVVSSADLEQSDDVKVETVGGVAKFHFTASPTWAGSVAEINFEVEDNTDVTGSTEVEVVAQKATSVKLTAPEFLPTNDTGAGYEDTVKVNVLDQAGEEMADGTWDLDIKVSGPAQLDNGTQTSTETLGDGDTFLIRPESAGDTGNVEVSVSGEGLTGAKATIKAAFAKDAAAMSLKSNKTSQAPAALATANNINNTNYFEFTAKLVDKAGVPVTSADNVMTVKFEGVSDKGRVFFSTSATTGYKALTADTVPAGDAQPDSATLTIQADPSENGIVKFYVAGDVADTFKVSLTDATGNLTSSAPVEVTIKAAAPAVIGFEGTDLILKKAKTATGELVAQLYDEFGNKAAVSGAKVTFATPSGDGYTGVKLNGSAKAAEVRTDANGQAKVKVDLTAANVTEAYIEVNGTWNDDPLETSTTALPQFHDEDVTVNDRVVVSMKSELPESLTGNFVALDGKRITSYALTDVDNNDVADGFSMKIVIKDELGAGIEDLNVTTDFKVTASESDAVANAEVELSTNPADAEGTYYVTGITPSATGTLTVDVKLVNYGAKNVVSKAIAVRAGAVADFEVTEASAFGEFDGKVLVETNKATAYTVQLLDKWGNAAGENAGVVNLSFDAYAEGSRKVNTRAAFIDIRDAEGAPLATSTIKTGRVNGKFYVLTNAEDAQFSVTVSGATVNDTKYYIVNPTGEYTAPTLP